MKRTFAWAGFAVFGLLMMLSFGRTGHLFAGETKERMVLLPIEGETLSDGDKALFQGAVKEGLSGRYEIFSGEQVEAKLQKFAVTSCTSDECLENIAIAFNGNLVGRGSVTQEGPDAFLRIEIKDVITDKDVFTKTDGCVGCSKTEIMKKLKAMAAGRSVSSSGGAVEFAIPTAPDRGPAEGAVTRITSKVSGDSGSTVAALFLDSEPSGAAVYLGDIVAGETPYQNMGLKAGQTVRIVLKKDDYHPKTLELKLSGGTNEIDTVRLKSIYGSVNITSEPSGATVYLSGKKMGETPYSNSKVLSGSYALVLKKDFYHSVEAQVIQVQEEKETRQHNVLSPQFGSLEVTSEPSGAEVLLAGKKMGTTPYTNAKVLSGTYLLSVRKDLYAPVENQTIQIVDEKATVKHLVLDVDFGTLSVASTPAGARAEISRKSGKTVHEETTPFSVRLSPETYEVHLEKDGYDSVSYTVTVARNGQQSIDAASAVLRRLEGTVIVSSEPYEKGAEVRVDGELKGHVPATLTVAAGEHEIAVKGRKLQGKQKVRVKDRETVTAQVKLKSGGDTFSNKIGMKFVYINPGTFMMGSPSSESGRYNNETLHQVTLTRGYYMQTTEVTQGQWRRVMGSNPSKFSNCGDNCPVEQVSWEDAQKFIRKLNQMDGHNRYRLPTEAEWEYACRAGTTTPFSTGDCLSTDQANYDGNNPLSGCPKGQYRQKTTPVGSFKPNAWGLYDMHGNVWEWCQDWKSDYPWGAVSEPEGPSSGSSRVLRGGSWDFYARGCRSAVRYGFNPGGGFSSDGFRLALSPGQ